MRRRIDNILIALLWLLAITLGATFWLNISKYHFNVFSAEHWAILATKQAAQEPVDKFFYISLALIVLIAFAGLFILLRPRRRQIVLPVFDRSTQSHTQVVSQNISVPQHGPQEPVQQIDSQPVVQPPQTENIDSGMTRPPRLNIPPLQTKQSTPRTPIVPLSSTAHNAHINPEQEYADIHEIFTSAGFVYKGSPRIKNVQTSVLAIGTDEILWLGANGVKTDDMQRAIDTLAGVFADTLEDIEIHIKSFIIGAPDASANANGSILQFATVDELRSYIMKNPNVPPDEEETENFDAYSAYIGTVVDYIGKI